MAEARILERFPDVYVSLSHRLLPVMRETRRWMTAVLNAFVHADTRRYLQTIDDNLRTAGFNASLSFFQGLRVAISRSRAEHYPLSLLRSGPAAGAIGAMTLAKSMGYGDVLLADMGHELRYGHHPAERAAHREERRS